MFSWNVAGARLEWFPPAVSVQSGQMGVCRILWWRNSLLRGTVIEPGFSTHSLWHWKLSSQASFKHRNSSYSMESQTCSARPGALCLSSSFAERELYGLACFVVCLNCLVTKTCAGSWNELWWNMKLHFSFSPNYILVFHMLLVLHFNFHIWINVNNQKAHLLNWVHETLTMYSFMKLLKIM